MEYKTRAKEEICSYLKKNRSIALSLEEICSGLEGSAIGKSTVYRIVSSLVKVGAVKRLSDGISRRATYQFIGDGACREHMHLKCKECGAIIHLEESISRRFLDGVKVLKGFSLDEGNLLLGRCVRCGEGDRHGEI